MKAVKMHEVLLLAVSLVILLGTVIFLGIRIGDKRSTVRERVERLNDVGLPYKEGYENMLVEHERLEAEYNEVHEVGRSMTMLIFQQCGDNLYEEVYLKATKGKKIGAVFTVNDKQMVGDPGCISLEICNQLLKEGWTLAIGTPVNETDFSEYLQTMREKLAALGLSYPEFFVFGKDTFSMEMLDTVLAEGFKAVAYRINGENGESELVEEPLTDKDGILYVPYFYTSKRTHIRNLYEKYIEGGRCSISTACALPGMKGTTAYTDTTIANLKDIVDTIAVYSHVYRNYKNYRAEKLKADTEYAEKLEELSVKIDACALRRDQFFDALMEIYNAPADTK